MSYVSVTGADRTSICSEEDDLPTTNMNSSHSSMPNPYGRPAYDRNGGSAYSGNAPLTSNAQVPAGHGMGQIGETGRPVQQSGMLDDDEEIIAARTKMSKKKAAPGVGIAETVKEAIKEAKRRMKGGHKMYTGERMIHINNQPLNDASKFCNNYVSTSKYNLVTFLPKFFIGEFRRLPSRRAELTLPLARRAIL